MSGLAPRIDPRSGRPVPADYVVAQDPAAYTAQDHATWRTLYLRQSSLLRGRVVGEFLSGLDALAIGSERIPDFAVLNDRLRRATGWEVVAVPGLVPDEVFFSHLAARRFPAGYWIRRPEELDYIEEPDVFHDIFGHVPLLMQRLYADYMQAYGMAGRRLAGSPHLARLARLYWYTVEFGLMRTPQGLRIFGAGIASSAGETVYALESPQPRRFHFDACQVLRMPYEIDHFQNVYFVLRGYDDLPALDPEHLAAMLRQARNLGDLTLPCSAQSAPSSATQRSPAGSLPTHV